MDSSYSLSHITDGETSKRGVVSESLDTHWLGRNHLDDGSVTRLDELRVVFDGFTGTTVDLLEDFSELTGDVRSVAIKNRSVAGTNLTWVIEDNDLGVEGIGTLGRVVLGVTSNVTTTNFLYGNVLDVEADVVTWETLDKLFVMHLDGLDFSGDTSRGEGDDHTGLDNTGLNTSNRHLAYISGVISEETTGVHTVPMPPIL
jgi:hypothetical protein